MFVRKQLTIGDHHERWLKRKVAETGESEAGWVRRALDAMMEVERFNLAAREGFDRALDSEARKADLARRG